MLGGTTQYWGDGIANIEHSKYILTWGSTAQQSPVVHPRWVVFALTQIFRYYRDISRTT